MITRIIGALMDPVAEWIVAYRENWQLRQLSWRAWLLALTIFVSAFYLIGLVMP